MIIFPALDLQLGKAVRLRRGLRDQSDVFGDDPLAMARLWQEAGAQWLHVVDLDGAFDGHSDNRTIIEAICSGTGLKVQVGGGIRTPGIAEKYLAAGATRLIIGTLALENPDLFAQMCAEFPGRIGVSLDADKGRLKSRGWVEDARLTLAEVLPRLEDAGASFIIYTDIERDGMRSGINLPALAQILELTPLPLIAAGGVASMDDVKNIFALRGHGNLEGMITGRAIYEHTLSLTDALAWLKAREES